MTAIRIAAAKTIPAIIHPHGVELELLLAGATVVDVVLVDDDVVVLGSVVVVADVEVVVLGSVVVVVDVEVVVVDSGVVSTVLVLVGSAASRATGEAAKGAPGDDGSEARTAVPPQPAPTATRTRRAAPARSRLNGVVMPPPSF
jgi:hypothetical protein